MADSKPDRAELQRQARKERRGTDRPVSGMIDKVVHIDRVTRVTEGGKDLSFSALVVIGDGRGTVGFGSGKAKEAPAAIRKGIESARKNMVSIAMSGGTIPYLVTGQHGTGKVLLKPASEGTGVIAGGPIKVILESAGIQNVLTKSVGTTNPYNVVKATFEALKNLRADIVAEFPDDIPTHVPSNEQSNEQMQRMIAAMLPSVPVPLPAHVLQARRNAVARDALLREFGALTSADVGELAGSKSPNRVALAHRWKSDGRIFAVQHHATNYFPGFQFSDACQPLPVIADVLKILGNVLSPWELALWFWKNNGVLGGGRAVDLLTSAPERVIEAAKEEAGELVF